VVVPEGEEALGPGELLGHLPVLLLGVLLLLLVLLLPLLGLLGLVALIRLGRLLRGGLRRRGLLLGLLRRLLGRLGGLGDGLLRRCVAAGRLRRVARGGEDTDEQKGEGGDGPDHRADLRDRKRGDEGGKAT